MLIDVKNTIPIPAFENAGIGICVSNVSIVYRNGHIAIHDASFTVPVGSITALVGINGSGKSTLFKGIMGFIRLAEGNICVLGLSINAALRKNLVAYVPQSEDIDWNFPVLVKDVVMMGRYGHMGILRLARDRDQKSVAEALARVGISDLCKRQIGELSGGQRKRVFLARALAQGAQVILLDEPFAGVDIETEEAIMKLMNVLRDEGKVILISTHNLRSVPEFCDRTVFVKNTVLAQGPTHNVFTRSNLEKTFGGFLRVRLKTNAH